MIKYMFKKIDEEILLAKKRYEEFLILNPTENVPLVANYSMDFAENLYNPEESRDETSKVIFGGRNSLHQFYNEWCELLKAQDVSFKPNSGLDAHILLFMSVSSFGDKVLLLSEEAGGHFSTAKILNRLGLEIKEFVFDYDTHKIDIPKSIKLIKDWSPQYIFVDRSEGLYYEDFSWLAQFKNIYKIFDASQYLSNIISGSYENPFNMGFDLILSTLHKNYPGPQKAAFFSNNSNSELWLSLKDGLSTYVSNIHPREVYKALSTIPTKEYFIFYSQTMLECAKSLDLALQDLNVPVVKRDFTLPFTQHIWLTDSSSEHAYNCFRNLEKMNIAVNYRKLPYGLGYGLRLGTAGGVRQGLRQTHCKDLAPIIQAAWNNDINDNILAQANCLLQTIMRKGTTSNV